MDYNTLFDVAIELGYRLAMCGAETFRVEETIRRVMATYGINAEAFAIPNCLHVSIETPAGEPMTRMRRIGYHGNDLDSVEKYSNLSRRICSEKPDPTTALHWLEDTKASCKRYPLWFFLIGNFLGACGFSVIFGGGLTDSLCSGLCGIIIGLMNHYMDKLKANTFFRTIAASFLMAFFAHWVAYLGFVRSTDAIIIGALMILVPGLIFTNAMRDIIYGDTNSGINRIVQVFLIAGAIALGTGAAWKLAGALWNLPNTPEPLMHNIPVELLACFIGCIGFSVLFNIHGPGMFICATGGLLTWLVYRLVLKLSGSDITSYFFATMVASLYAEIMARIRKYPAISYLVVSAFPLIPGAGVYYTMNYAVTGDMANFANQGIHTVAIAGVMAVGILLVSTIVRFFNMFVHHKNK